MVKRGLLDDGLEAQWRREELALARARCNRFLTSIKVWMVSAQRLARRREIVSRPPRNILSTATAEPEDVFEKVACIRLITHQKYIICHEPCSTGLGTELVGQSTSELDYMHQSLLQGVWGILQVHWWTLFLSCDIRLWTISEASLQPRMKIGQMRQEVMIMMA